MGKRSRSRDDFEGLVKAKLKKLEEKLLRGRHKRRRKTAKPPPPPPTISSPPSSPSTASSSSDSDSESDRSDLSSHGNSPSPSYSDLSVINDDGPPDQPRSPTAIPPAPAPTSVPAPDAASDDATPGPSSSLVSAPEEPAVIPPELLQLLGEDPSFVKKYGKDIQADLALRLQHVATKGLTKETRKELLDKYLPPGNCSLIDAPALNPELKAAVSEAVLKRDRGIEQRQKQITSAISCIAEALTSLFASNNKDTTLMTLLIDASRLLCDSQNFDSMTRRNFVSYSTKKEMKDQLQATNIDKFLFSQDLAETLKTAKAISKSGADLKVPIIKPPAVKKDSSKNIPSQRNLNWRAPPQNRRPKGPQRTTTPATAPTTKIRQESSSRPSSRRVPSHYNR